MTIIAFKDGVLAADKQSTFDGLGWKTTKIRRLADGRLVGASGNTSKCRAMVDWLEAKKPNGEYPDTKNECAMMVVNLDGKVFLYDDGPTPVEIEDGFHAMGSGRDYAVAAMHLGCDAVKAVEVACKFDISCGRGIDILKLNPD